MAQKQERRKQQRKRQLSEYLPSKLHPEEEQRLDSQCLDLKGIAQQVCAQLLVDRQLGEMILRIQAEGLWRKARRRRNAGCMEFLAERCGLARSTLEQRMALAKTYSIEEVQQHAAD